MLGYGMPLTLKMNCTLEGWGEEVLIPPRFHFYFYENKHGKFGCAIDKVFEKGKENKGEVGYNVWGHGTT